MMKDNKHGHRHGRNARSFEEHSLPKSVRHCDVSLRKGRAWRFYDARTFCLNPFEPHFRATARTLALPGKHFRSVEEPVRAAHGKTL